MTTDTEITTNNTSYFGFFNHFFSDMTDPDNLIAILGTAGMMLILFVPTIIIVAKKKKET